MSRVFVAVDFSFIDDSKWYDFTTATNQFQKDTGVFVSIPQIPGRNPAAIKMRQESVRNSDGTVSFSIKIVQPNDSYCNKSFGWIPQYLKPTLISWMVFEYGAYNINGNTFIAGKGSITRQSFSTTATVTNGNLVIIPFPTGCDSTTISCAITPTNRGAINLLQTNINAKDPTKDMYLTVRARIIDARRGQWVLVPHDVIPRDFNTYFSLTTPEVLAYLVFLTGIQIECFEKMIWETRTIENNYVPLQINYVNVYDYAPGIYGMVGTITSLADTVLVSANWTSTSSVISINEDQCAKVEYFHTTPETIYLVVIGEKKATTSTYQCYVNFNSALDPTSAPTTFPTFLPSAKPTTLPTILPSAKPTLNPTRAPTTAPTSAPTTAPTRAPTTSPTVAPTFTPSSNPTFTPTGATASPTFNPTANPTRAPTFNPTLTPSSFPTFNPSSFPTFRPSANPTLTPSVNPTLTPSSFPTFAPSSNPTYTPSSFPTFNPSTNPTFTPSSFPTFAPSSKPTFNPSFNPTFAPSSNPTFKPSSNPTFKPTISPTFAPSTSPTFSPSSVPTLKPTVPPTFRPTTPTVSPTMSPTYQPTKLCTSAFPVKIKKVQV